MTTKRFAAGGRAFFIAHGVPLVVFVGLATAFLADVLFTDKSLAAFDIILSQPNWYGEYPIPGVHQSILLDSPTAHYPQRMHDWSTLRHGVNATYNPYIFTGMPWSPQGVGAFLTSIPQTFLQVPDALDWSIWLRLILAGFFMYLFLMEWGIGKAASVFGGVVWAYNLHQIVWLQFPQHLATQLWIPLLLLANLWVLRYGFRRDYVAALILVNVLFFTSGYTQIVLYTYIAVGLFNTLYLLILERGPPADRARSWVLIHLVYICATLFYAAAIFSEMQFINEGLRGVQEFRGKVTDFEWSWDSVWAFVTSLVPGIQEIKRFYTPDYYGGIWGDVYRDPYLGNIVESGAYAGAVTVLCVVAAVLALRDSARRRAVIVFLILLAVFLSAYHRDSVTIFLLNLIPLADKGSYGRFITLVVFFATTVAAFGFAEICARSVASRRAGVLAAVGVFVVLPIVGWAVDRELDLAALGHPFLIGGVAVVLAMALVPVLGKHRLAPVLMVAVIVGDLFYATYAFNTRVSNERIFPTNNVIRFLLNDADPYRVAVISDEPLYRSNLLSYYRIPTVEGYSTVLPNEYARFINAVFDRYHITHNGMLFLLEPNVEALRLLNVKYVLSDRELTDPGVRKLFASNNHFVYRVRDWLPRAYCASDIIVKSEREIYRKLKGAIRSAARPALVVDRLDAEGGDCEVKAVEAYIHGARFTVSAVAERLVILPYAYVSGWRAWVDGEPAAVVPVNAAFLGVPVPAGTSQVSVHYRNRIDMLGAVVLMAGAIVLVWVAASIPVRHFAHVVLMGVAAIVLVKSALSLSWAILPGIPERDPPREPFTVEEIRVQRDASTQPGMRLAAGKPITAALEVPAAGLTRVGFKAASYRQPQLPYDLIVTLHDDRGRELAQTRVKGAYVIDNEWFFVDFPTLELPADTRLTAKIRASKTPSAPFSLWLNERGQPSLRAYYAFDPQGAVD